MSDVMVRGSTDLAIPGSDPFSSYGAKVGVQGTFLTFKNGEYLAGQDGTEIPIGTRVAVNMQGLRTGWRRWFKDELTDDLTELLTDQVPLKQRNELGDLDESLWEKDDKGNLRDPWQFTNVIEFVNSDGETFIYSTGSKGGVGAIGKLCKAYGKEYRQRPGQVPIVTLDRDFYMHKKHGKTYFPVFTIVDWADEDALDAIVGETPPKDEKPVEQPRTAKKTRF